MPLLPPVTTATLSFKCICDFRVGSWLGWKLPVLPLWIEVLFQSLPAVGIAAIEQLELGCERGRAQRITRLEHERHRARQLVRLERRLRRAFECLGVGTMRDQRVV